MNIKRYIMAAGDVMLPRRCCVCGCRLNIDERHICLSCQADMPLTRFWERSHNPMADSFNEKIQERLKGYEHYAYAASLFFYHSEAGYRQIAYQIKYQGNIAIGKHFGRILGKKLAGGYMADVDLVIPVPLHWTRKWKRGYNQAEIIAGALAEAMGTVMRNDILIRRKRTATQVRLSMEEKVSNVDGAFSVTGEAAAEFPGGSGIRHILLVDDVFTTGSTMTACFHALRKLFPPSVRISAASLGYLER